MSKDSRELELEFNMFNRDMTAKLNVYGTNIKTTNADVTTLSESVAKINQEQVALKAASLLQGKFWKNYIVFVEIGLKIFNIFLK